MMSLPPDEAIVAALILVGFVVMSWCLLEFMR